MHAAWSPLLTVRVLSGMRPRFADIRTGLFTYCGHVRGSPDPFDRRSFVLRRFSFRRMDGWLAALRWARRHEDVQSQLPMAALSKRLLWQGTQGTAGYSGVLQVHTATPAGTGCSRQEALRHRTRPSLGLMLITGHGRLSSRKKVDHRDQSTKFSNEFCKNDRLCRLVHYSSWGLLHRPRFVARLIDGDLRTVFSARSCDSYHAGVHTTVVASVRPGPSSSRLSVMGDGSGKSAVLRVPPVPTVASARTKINWSDEFNRHDGRTGAVLI